MATLSSPVAFAESSSLTSSSTTVFFVALENLDRWPSTARRWQLLPHERPPASPEEGLDLFQGPAFGFWNTAACE